MAFDRCSIKDYLLTYLLTYLQLEGMTELEATKALKPPARTVLLCGEYN